MFSWVILNTLNVYTDSWFPSEFVSSPFISSPSVTTPLWISTVSWHLMLPVSLFPWNLHYYSCCCHVFTQFHYSFFFDREQPGISLSSLSLTCWDRQGELVYRSLSRVETLTQTHITVRLSRGHALTLSQQETGIINSSGIVRGICMAIFTRHNYCQSGDCNHQGIHRGGEQGEYLPHSFWTTSVAPEDKRLHHVQWLLQCKKGCTKIFMLLPSSLQENQMKAFPSCCILQKDLRKEHFIFYITAAAVN